MIGEHTAEVLAEFLPPQDRTPAGVGNAESLEAAGGLA
jgi:hypothetical protein